MGVSAFFRWLSSRYPKIMVEVMENLSGDVLEGEQVDITQPNENNIEFDNLYLDLNGIVHNCTHGEELVIRPECEDQMFELIFKYIDRLVAAARPRRLLYIAVDGVAPRAKMNQQRSRRFRASKEMQQNDEIEERFRSSLIARGQVPPEKKKKSWDHNVITPGTPFMARLCEGLRHYIHDRKTNNPGWKDLIVILSDPQAPGEGEHKIVKFIRHQRTLPNYDPNTRHILHGLDADLIMLGLMTHEPYFTIFREQVFRPRGPPKSFGEGPSQVQKDMMKLAARKRFETGEARAMFEKPLRFLHIHVLREYLEVEFASIKELLEKKHEYDFENIVDDFVFMCFFIGNDFLPHLPSLDIREGGIEFLLNIYKRLAPENGYLTKNGEAILARVDKFLHEVGKEENEIMRRRNGQEERRKRDKFKPCFQFRAGTCTRGDRCRFMHPKSQVSTKVKVEPKPEPAPAPKPMSNADAAKALRAKLSGKKVEEAKPAMALDKYDEELKMQLKTVKFDDEVEDNVKLGTEGWKDRYYEEKFGKGFFSDKKRMRHLVCKYVEGLCWVMHYYYRGCASWSWFYPYHFAPMSSDLKQLHDIEIAFDPATPFKPFNQLMAVQPASGAHMLPPACEFLMSNPASPIIDFYPDKFKFDPDGKPQKWLWVALLPWINEKRLLDTMAQVEPTFTEEEKRRNTHGHDVVYFHASSPVIEHWRGRKEKPGEFTSIGLDLARIGGLLEAGKCECQATDSYPGFLNFPPIEGNQCIGITFQDPPMGKGHHKCHFLDGAKPAPPVLTDKDRMGISENRRRRGVNIADLGRGRVTGKRDYSSLGGGTNSWGGLQVQQRKMGRASGYQSTGARPPYGAGRPYYQPRPRGRPAYRQHPPPRPRGGGLLPHPPRGQRPRHGYSAYPPRNRSSGYSQHRQAPRGYQSQSYQSQSYRYGGQDRSPRTQRPPARRGYPQQRPRGGAQAPYKPLPLPSPRGASRGWSPLPRNIGYLSPGQHHWQR